VAAARRSRAWIAVVTTLVVIAGAAMWVRGSGMTSRRKAWPLEEWLARSTRQFFMPAAARKTPNPVPASPEVIRAGMAHFADQCASCHANDGSGDVVMGHAMFPRAPDMRTVPTQAMTDGELFYVIEHGIPMTGMPAWGNGTPDGERSTWELVRFIRHLPKLSAAEIREMEALNPRSPAQERRAKDIDDFLSGRGKT